MMIKITSACSMGCKHCMNDSQPNGQHMDMSMFYKAISFQRDFGGPLVIITGGEPTENPDFEAMVRYAASTVVSYPIQMPLLVVITTNGKWMQYNYDFVKSTCDRNIMWQVTTVPGLYPEQIDTSLDVFKLRNVMIFREIENMYPMGRAKTNNLPWKAKASKCFNIRAITRQLANPNRSSNCSLRTILSTMASKGKMCTPHIAPNGAIKLGESDLCPVCSWIHKPEHEIIKDILNFNCHQCDFINDKLSPEYQLLLKGDNKEVS